MPYTFVLNQLNQVAFYCIWNSIYIYLLSLPTPVFLARENILMDELGVNLIGHVSQINSN